MANCPNYNCAGWEERVEGDCGETFLGGGASAVMVKCGTTIADPSDGAEINAAVAAGNAVIINDVLVTFAAPSAITNDSFIANQPEIVADYDREVSFVDRAVTAQNVEFYNSINSSYGAQIGGMIIYEAEADRVTYIDAAMTGTGGRVFANGEIQRFEFTFAYRAKGDAPIYDAPTGVFNQ